MRDDFKEIISRHYRENIHIPRDDYTYKKLNQLRKENPAFDKEIVRLSLKDREAEEEGKPKAVFLWTEIHLTLKRHRIELRPLEESLLEDGFKSYDLMVYVLVQWQRFSSSIEAYLNCHDIPSKFFVNDKVLIKEGEEKEFKEFLRKKFCIPRKRISFLKKDN